MVKPSQASSAYRTIRTGVADHHDARSSASDTSVVAPATSKRKLSHATIRHPRTRTTSNPPFQVSLNLVMKVQPLGNDEYCAEPIELSVNDINVNMPKKVQQLQRGKQQSQLGDSSVVYLPNTWMSDEPRRKNCERGRDPSVAHGYASDLDDSVFLPKEKEVVQVNKDSEESAKTNRSRVEQPRKTDNAEGKTSDSRTSQCSNASKDLSKGKKKTPAVNRYKIKRSLRQFSSLKKPRNKSSVRFDDNLPKPLSFDQSDDEVTEPRTSDIHKGLPAAADKKKNQTPGNRYRNKESLLRFASLKKPRSKSEGHSLPGFEPFSPPRRLNFDVTDGQMEGDERETMRSDAADRTSPLNRSLGPGELNDSLVSNGKSDGKKDSTLGSDASVSLSDVPSKDVACDFDVGQFHIHKKQVRLGFLANGIHMAVNLVLNLRSDEEVLYLEPVELIYEGEKMWRRPVRQVAKEIEAKRLADKKKKEEGLNLSAACSDSFKSAPTDPLSPKTPK